MPSSVEASAQIHIFGPKPGEFQKINQKSIGIFIINVQRQFFLNYINEEQTKLLEAFKS